MQNIASTENLFLREEKNVIEKSIDVADESLMGISFKYFSLLEEKKRLQTEKARFIDAQLRFQKRLSELFRSIMRFSSVLSFESDAGICVRRITQANNQFQRCRRALTENAVNSFFDDLPYSGLTLQEAYKIENTIKLKEFEERLAQTPEASLKGLFCVAEESQLYKMIVFGMNKVAHPLAQYTKRILRVPQAFIKSNKHKVDANDTQVPPSLSISSMQNVVQQILA